MPHACPSCTYFDRMRFETCLAKGGSADACVTMLPCLVSTAELRRLTHQSPHTYGPFSLFFRA